MSIVIKSFMSFHEISRLHAKYKYIEILLFLDSAMLEHQSQRCISLLEVVDICYKEAKQRKMELSQQPPSLSPGDDCHVCNIFIKGWII